MNIMTNFAKYVKEFDMDGNTYRSNVISISKTYGSFYNKGTVTFNFDIKYKLGFFPYSTADVEISLNMNNPEILNIDQSKVDESTIEFIMSQESTFLYPSPPIRNDIIENLVTKLYSDKAFCRILGLPYKEDD